ncbi:Uncharacterised protein [Streptococcus acidominimus]|uniref:DUF551 domain-containing protein n=1 Tax=Streptococcus acidominimus TaxID=1326 RepID=A0A239WZ97_STRAI|nr:hypothetical protein [Streptococcus acidominimus]SNV39825.1 Uncharacterised protein [Streptococcus acidominimus]
MKWNKLTKRTLTDEEKELYPNCDFMWDGNTPDIGERVLVFSYGEVEVDTWEDFGANGVGFENYDDEVIYWMSLPGSPVEELE